MKSKKATALVLIVAMALITVLPFIACSGGGLYSEGTGELNVVCTNFPPFDFARVVGGDKVTVTILQDTGADLHNYAPTSAAIMAIKNADAFICVGGSSDEAWLDSTLNSAANDDLRIIKLTEHAELLPTPETFQAHDHGEGEEDHDHEEECDHDHAHDEHVWTSLDNTEMAIKAIAAAFAELDSANADYYRANAAAYCEKLEKLDEQYDEAVENATKKTLVFADRFPFIYMTHEYGLGYHAAFSGCSTEVNASFETTKRLIDAVQNEGLTCIVVCDVSPENAPAVAATVASSTGAKIVSMNSCQAVTRSVIQNGATYLDIMTENLTALKNALN